MFALTLEAMREGSHGVNRGGYALSHQPPEGKRAVDVFDKIRDHVLKKNLKKTLLQIIFVLKKLSFSTNRLFFNYSNIFN